MSANPLIAGPVDTATGIGWVLDHVEPLKSWLNDLTGNAVTAYLGKSHRVTHAVHAVGVASNSDVLLLQHEIAEHRLMSTNPGMSYADAHRQANTIFNWQAIIAELSDSWPFLASLQNSPGPQTR